MSQQPLKLVKYSNELGSLSKPGDHHLFPNRILTSKLPVYCISLVGFIYTCRSYGITHYYISDLADKVMDGCYHTVKLAIDLLVDAGVVTHTLVNQDKEEEQPIHVIDLTPDWTPKEYVKTVKSGIVEDHVIWSIEEDYSMYKFLEANRKDLLESLLKKAEPGYIELHLDTILFRIMSKTGRASSLTPIDELRIDSSEKRDALHILEDRCLLIKVDDGIKVHYGLAPTLAEEYIDWYYSNTNRDIEEVTELLISIDEVIDGLLESKKGRYSDRIIELARPDIGVYNK